MKASNLVLEYVLENQNGLPGHLSPPRPYAIDHHFLIIDETTRFHLNLIGPSRHRRRKGTLLWALDKTQTAMGSRHLQQRLLGPSTNQKQIETWHNEVEAMMTSPMTLKGVGTALKGVYDLERLTARVASKRASPRDLGQLRKSLAELPSLVETLNKSKAKELKTNAKAIDLLSDMHAELDAALVAEPPLTQKEGGIFRSGFDADLDEFVMLATDSRQMIARIEEREREATGIPNLKVKHTRVFGYYIEVTRPIYHGSRALSKKTDHCER